MTVTVQCSPFNVQPTRGSNKKTLTYTLWQYAWMISLFSLARKIWNDKGEEKKKRVMWVLDSIVSFGNSIENQTDRLTDWLTDWLTLNITANNKTWIGQRFFFPLVISPPCNQMEWKEMGCVLIIRGFMAFIYSDFIDVWWLVTTSNSITHLIDDQFHSHYSI